MNTVNFGKERLKRVFFYFFFTFPLPNYIQSLDSKVETVTCALFFVW